MRALWLWPLFVACGEAVEPTAACQAWTSCVAARDAVAGIETDVVRFAPGGACWDNPEIAELCDRGCVSGLDWLRETEPGAPAACQP
jgi:hypothetical protein